jgi:hypothetical protein
MPKKNSHHAQEADPTNPDDNTARRQVATDGPQFAESIPTLDPTHFSVQHGSDKNAYTILDHQRGKPQPLAFPVLANTVEPVVRLAEAFGKQGENIVGQIAAAGQIVFHSLGDTGNTKGPESQG